MGKMTGSNPSYFRIALTLYSSIVEFPSSSSSSSSSSPVSTSSSSSSSSSSSEESSSSSFSSSEVTSSETTSTVNSYASSILALDYSRSFKFEYRSEFAKASSSSTTSSSVDDTSSTSDTSSSEESSESSTTGISDILSDGVSHLFHGVYAEDGSSNLFFQITLADDVSIPGYLLVLFLKAKLYSDHVDVTIPVSISDGIKAILNEDVTKYHTVTVGLNKE